MNPYEHLVGQDFLRNGVRHTVVKCVGATVVAAYLERNKVHRTLVRLAEVLDALEVTEISMTVPPVPKQTRARSVRRPANQAG